ncbi:MAG TPA: hypothetical protein VH640_10745 [Bryobacteraceae bacterium]|jgi:hypothetical protein
MDLDKKYALIESIPGQGASSYRGRQIESGRDVTVHLVRGGRAENENLLSRIRTLPPESLRQVIEVGEQEGTLYLVTTAPPHRHFSEWLPEQERVTSAGPGEFTRFFEPNALQPERPSAPTLAPGADTPRAGEFTRLFGPATPQIPTDEPQFNPPSPGHAPGEYTRVIARSLVPAVLQPGEAALAPAPPPTEVASVPTGRRTVSPVAALIFCLLSFLAGGTLVFLILRR